MTFFFFEPEVAGELGERTVLDSSTHPPKVEKLHYKFGGWLGDGILETFPCFIVVMPAVEALVQAKLTGFHFDEVETSASEEFNELYPGRALPEFRWLKVDGTAGVDDFGIASDFRLVLSKSALEILRPFGIKNGLVEDFS